MRSEIIGVNQQKQLRSILDGMKQTNSDLDIDLSGGN